MNKNNKILSDITVWNKYARYKHEKQRRETYAEVCTRYKEMMITRYPEVKDRIEDSIHKIEAREILPSMRGMQFAGKAIEKNESRIYNCAFLPVDDYRAFSETMFLLLGGTGVGYSVQAHHINRLPSIQTPLQSQKYVIEDSIEGWADAVKYLMKSYFGLRKYKPRFDFSAIREKGARLVTAGGKAPGAGPLKRCLLEIELILSRLPDGRRLSSVECHDIQCHIADAVLAGGIRRAAMISLFDRFDTDMITCKSGTWWETNGQRGRANNSAVLPRNEVTEDEFMKLWSLIKASGSGEPGVYWTNNRDWGTNPCCEIALKPFQFCNLTEINVSIIKTQEELEENIGVASFFGTLQAGITDFHYLRPIWRETTEEDALIGVGMTGIATHSVGTLDLKAAAAVAVNTNIEAAKLIGINPSSRVTTVKPSGSTSCVVGSSSGIHAWHGEYYIRRMELSAGEAIVPYLLQNHPELIKPLERRPGDYVLEFPQKAPKGAIIRTEETAVEFLDRVYRFNTEWVQEGHVKGDNCNNVSATCSIRPEEWVYVGNWMWNKRNTYNGMSVLPYYEEDSTYTQMPFETIDKETFDKMYESLRAIDISSITETEDGTTLTDNVACAGGACEIV